MKTNNSVIEKDISKGDVLPARELIQGKAFKQHGNLIIENETFEYFLERIKGSEDTMEIITPDLSIVEVDCAIFEVYLKNDLGIWTIAERGVLPTDIDLYDPDTGPKFML